MLPDLNEHGYLPPGIHRCELEELTTRFGSGSPEREVATRELHRFLDWARIIGVVRILVDGSYVTGKLAPNDIDMVVLPPTGRPAESMPGSAWEESWPFLHLIVAADDHDLESWAKMDFATDRRGLPKGIVELVSWTTT